MIVPLESVEQVALATYLDVNKYTFSAIRNESDFHNIRKGAKRKREGVRKGIPDFLIILKRRSILLIELKRQRPMSQKTGKRLKSPSTVSIEQNKWIGELNECSNVQGAIAYGSKEAIKLIKEIEES